MATERPPLPERMAAAARELEGQSDPRDTMESAVQLAVTNVRGCDGAGLSLVRRHGKVETPSWTDDYVLRCDRLQNELGEGPCLDAIWQERVVHSGHLRREDRWPQWAPRVADEAGIASMLCFRLFTHEDTVGALNLYSRSVHGFDEEDRDDGLVLAAHISVAVAAALEVESLTVALDSRTVIGQAVGIVMERFDLDADTAFRVLGRLSSHANVKMRTLAEEIVATRRIPGSEVGAAPPVSHQPS